MLVVPNLFTPLNVGIELGLAFALGTKYAVLQPSQKKLSEQWQSLLQGPL